MPRIPWRSDTRGFIKLVGGGHLLMSPLSIRAQWKIERENPAEERENGEFSFDFHHDSSLRARYIVCGSLFDILLAKKDVLCEQRQHGIFQFFQIDCHCHSPYCLNPPPHVAPSTLTRIFYPKKKIPPQFDNNADF